MRDSGCPQAVTSLTKEKCREAVRGDAGCEPLLLALCQAITNFSMDPKTQVLMEVNMWAYAHTLTHTYTGGRWISSES